MKKITLMAVTTLFAVGAAQAAIFLGTVDTDFTNTNNWDTLAYPSTAEQAYIDTVADMTNAAPNGIQAIRVGTSAGTTGVLNLHTNADLQAASHTSWDSHIGTSGNGTLNMLGGTAGINFMEVGRNSTATGVVNVVSGYLRITRGSRDGRGYSLHLGSSDNHSAGGLGIVEITGGTFLTRFGIEVGNESNTGTGVFSVQGTNANPIIIGDTNDGRWYQTSNSVLRIGIDGGVTPILVQDFSADNNGNGNVMFEAGSILEVDFLNGVETGTWDVMTCDGSMVNLGLVLSSNAVASGWNAGIEGSTLRVAYGEDAPGDLEPPTTPLAPGTLTVHPTNSFLAALSWGDASGADTYNIYRSTTSGGPYTNIASGVTTNVYDDTGLTAGTKYYYVVAGVNAQGEGLLSNEENALVTAYTIITYGDPYNSDYTVYNAFDDDTGTHYDGETDDAWIGLDFGAGNEQQILGVSFVLRNYGSAVSFATNATFEGASDIAFLDAEVLATVQAPLDGNPNWNSYTVTNTTAFRYVRLMTAPQLRSKSFAEVRFLLASDFTSNGTPKLWLEGHGLSEADDDLDVDTPQGDGMLTWEEYVAGTDPTDPNSVLQLNSIEDTTNGMVIAWQSVEGKTYNVVTNGALLGGSEGTAATVTGLAGETSYTGLVSSADSLFYKIEVE